MSILIKGMEMPQPKFADMATVYDAYILVNPNGRAVIVVDNENGLDSTEYTLVPVPPHGRLIDADALAKVMADGIAPSTKDCGFQHPFDIFRAISDAPTIIPAEK